jgi:soluble lytic murein transglycosylase
LAFPWRFCLFFLTLGNLVSCKGEEVLQLSREEAAQRLRNGDIGFVLAADPLQLSELKNLHPAAPFYGGLLVQAAEPGADPGSDRQATRRSALALFEIALESPAPLVRAAAAQELLAPLLEEDQEGKSLARRIAAHIPQTLLTPDDPGNKTPDSSKNLRTKGHELSLYGAALYRLGRFDAALGLLEQQAVKSSWDRAIMLLSLLCLEDTKAHEEGLDFLLSDAPTRAAIWAFQEIKHRAPEFLSPPESSAIAGRLAVSDSSYREGLRYFRLVLSEEPALFFQYPELTGDLGRCFQFTGTQAEGLSLFLAWERVVASALNRGSEVTEPDGDVLDKTIEATEATEVTETIEKIIETIDVPNMRYRLLYFAGRMERQRGQYAQAEDYFKAALAFAPDALQEDACIWYIIHAAVVNDPARAVALVDTYLLRGHDNRYFADVLDLLCRYLTANRRWEDLLGIFSRIRSWSDGATTAQYAYILGRAVSERYISPEQGAAALEAADMTASGDLKTTVARTFFRIAFEESDASFYYRVMSAFQLGDKLIPVSRDAPQAEEPELSPGTEPFPQEHLAFLLGFFEFGAERFAFSYLQTMQQELSIPELRTLAKTFAAAGRWEESIRIITAFMSRETYVLRYEDLRLYYPRPFREIIETNARDAGMPPELLYGLVRTESAFNPNIVSHAGAVGLTQLMTATAQEVAGRIRKEGGPEYRGEEGLLDLKNPAVNVHMGASYLRYLMDRLESNFQALLAYNGGMTRVRRWRKAEPLFPEDLFLETIGITETRTYGKRVLAAAAAYGYLYFDLPMEAIVAVLYKDLQ